MTDELPAHSPLGASGAHRWRKCPGSVRRTAGLPDTAGYEAALGTVFHEFAGLCLEHGLDPIGFVGAKSTVEGHGTFEFTTEMAMNMLPGLDLARSYMDFPGALALVEKKVSIAEITAPGTISTLDLGIFDPLNWRIVIFDWKYGAGVPVSPVENDQAMIYALGGWYDGGADHFYNAHSSGQGPTGSKFDPLNMPDIEVIIIIEQPRAPGGGGIWRTTLGRLLEEAKGIKADAARTLGPDAPCVPGTEQCKFCGAAKTNSCPEREEFLERLAFSDYDAIDSAEDWTRTVDVRAAVSVERRSFILRHKAMVEGWLKQLHDAAYRDAEFGRPVPGMKLVKGRRPDRAWKDPDKAEAILTSRFGDKAYAPKKLLSPAALEGEVGKRTYKEHYARHVDQGEAKPILVTEETKGEPVKDVHSDLPDPEESLV